MVNYTNRDYITSLSATDTTDGIKDGVDKLHAAIIRTLEQSARGNYVVSYGASNFVQEAGSTRTRFKFSGNISFMRDGVVTTSTPTQVELDSNADGTYNRYDLIVINASDALDVREGTADAAPRTADNLTAGDIPVALVEVAANSGANVTDRKVQLFGYDKTSNSISLAYKNASNLYTEMSKITAASGGTTIEVGTAGGDFTIDNTDADKKIVMRLGSDDANTDFEVRNNSDAVKFGVDGAGTTTIAGTVNLGSVVNAGTDTDKFLVLDSGGNVDFRTGTEVVSDIGALTAEADTLDTVTGRGSSTANTITVGSLVSSGYIAGDPVVEAGAAIGGTDLYYFINTAAISLPAAASVAQRLFFVKNITNATCVITPQPGEFIDAVSSHAPTGINPNPDQRTAGAAITLESGESIILVAMTDSVSPLVNGYYVFSLDTQTGISNVVEDTTPQLGGDLDTNSNDITGDFALTGAVQMKKAVISVGNVSPAASAADSGKYFYRANTETANFTLPADTYVGEQYVLMNNSGSSITIASTGGDTIVGSTSVPHESAVTIIAVAANTWFVVG